MKPKVLRSFLLAMLLASLRCESGSAAQLPGLTVITVSATDNSAAERGQDTATFTISRSGETSSAATVLCEVTGTATLGSDFTLTAPNGPKVSNFVVIPAGSSSVAVSLRPIDDTQAEEVERVRLTLRSSITSTAGSPNSAEASIIDDDTTVTVSANPAQLDETNGNTAVVTFTRSGSTTQPLTVGYSVGGTATKGIIGQAGADYRLNPDANPPAVTIDGGQMSKTISVSVIMDTVQEVDETVVISLSAAGLTYKLGSPSSTTVTIRELPLPSIGITGPSNDASETGPTPATFTVSRVGALNAALVVFFEINPPSVSTGGITLSDGTQPATLGSDYTLQAGTNTIPPGSTSGSLTIPPGAPSATITVTPIDDLVPEVTERVDIELKPKPTYLFGSLAKSSLRIIDNDLSTVTISATDPNATEDGDFGAFTVTRTNQLSSDLRVNFRTSPLLVGSGDGQLAAPGSDFVLQSASGATLVDNVTIPAGSSSATIHLKPIDDTQIEPDEAAIVELSAGTTNLYLVQASAGRATITIKDNDTNILSVVAADANASESGPDPGTFKVSRTGSTAASLTVFYSMTGVATNGQDYNLLSGSLTISAGQSSAGIDIVPIKDQQIEDAESVILTLSPNTAYVLGSKLSATVTIAGN